MRKSAIGPDGLHHRATISVAEVERVAELRRSGLTGREIAAETGQTLATVREIIGGTSWAHITGGRVPRGVRPSGRYAPTAVRFWRSVDMSAGRDGCWIWQGQIAVTGYGRFSADGASWSAHRWALSQVMRPERGDLMACHHCDNPPCVNPRHLYWGTAADNSRDKVERGRASRMVGTDNPQALLTEAEVLEARKRYAAGGVRLSDLGAQYGVSGGAMALAVRGANWQQVERVERPKLGIRSHKLSYQQIAEIKDRYARGELQKALAKEYRVSRPVVSKVCGGFYG